MRDERKRGVVTPKPVNVVADWTIVRAKTQPSASTNATVFVGSRS